MKIFLNRFVTIVTKVHFASFFLMLFCLFILGLSIRGNYGSPDVNQLNSAAWEVNGPFELSPEKGRFALTYSLLENHSFQFSDNLANFAAPDVAVTKNGKYASLFAPTLSFITMPGYTIGKFFNISQVGTFSVIALFALLNLCLIRAIAIKLGANKLAATLGGVVFVFATPAFAYGVNLYQHHVSTFLILSSIYLLIRFKGFVSLFLIFLLCSLALTLDYPNLFMMFPIGLVCLSRMISFTRIRNSLKFSIKIPLIVSTVALIFPLLFFLWFNNASFGNPFQLSGTLRTIKDVSKVQTDKSSSKGVQPGLGKVPRKEKTAVGFFTTRNLTNGLYLLFISPDRGMIFYTPVMLFGIIGIILAIKKKARMSVLMVAIIGANILLYSLWADPWGGWAFGSRYLIPTYAILSIFIALFLTFWSNKYFLMPVFAFAAFYSVAVNTLGAITTSALPPQVEVLELEKLSGLVQKYTYERNWDFLLAGHSKSFVYQTFLKDYLSTFQFYMILTISICAFIAILLIFYIKSSEKKGNSNA